MPELRYPRHGPGGLGMEEDREEILMADETLVDDHLFLVGYTRSTVQHG